MGDTEDNVSNGETFLFQEKKNKQKKHKYLTQ